MELEVKTYRQVPSGIINFLLNTYYRMPNYHIYSNCCFKKSDRPYIYSVDMMIAYVNIIKPSPVKVDIDILVPYLESNLWGDFSPIDVMKNPTHKKYISHIKRIHDADLSYPIFLTNTNDIIDGAHRVSKALTLGKKTISAYIFDKSLMKKFIIHKGFDGNKIDEDGAQKIQIHTILEQFVKSIKTLL